MNDYNVNDNSQDENSLYFCVNGRCSLCSTLYPTSIASFAAHTTKTITITALSRRTSANLSKMYIFLAIHKMENNNIAIPQKKKSVLFFCLFYI